MAQDDAERLLELMERPKEAANEGLAPGYRWGTLQEAGIGRPVPEMTTVRRGNKIVPVETKASKLAYAAWKLHDGLFSTERRQKRLQFGEASSIALHDDMELERQRRDQSLATAKPVENKGVKPILRIIRV